MSRHSHLPLAVVALGGNALLRRGEPVDADHQRENAIKAADAIAEMSEHYRIVLTHGSGPQVGLLAQQSESTEDVPAFPLDVLGAETEGMIGYVLQQAVHNALPHREIVTLLTQIVVDRYDPAFREPTKPIGLFYDEVTAKRLAKERGWAVRRDGDAYRRVVASPRPISVVEITTIERLISQDVVVICAGGGGIPVAQTVAGGLAGVEAVIDKDRAAATLADALDASYLVMLTDVEAVISGWGTKHARPYREVAPTTLAQESFATGSMGPKVEAACRFVARNGRVARIGSLDRAVDTASGAAGTTIAPDVETKWWGAAKPVGSSAHHR